GGGRRVPRRARQRVAIGAIPVALYRHLVLVVGLPHPRPADRHAPAAQGHRPARVAVTLGDPVGVVLALRADDLVDLELHQLVNDAEPDTHAQREQALSRRPDKLAERLMNLRWKWALRSLQGRDDLAGGYLLQLRSFL